jgi:hypothetical protein
MRGIAVSVLILSIVTLSGAVVWRRVTGREVGAVAARRLGAVEVVLQAAIGVALVAVVASTLLFVLNDS